MHKQQGWPQAWEYSQAKLIQTLGRASQGVDWSWSQCIKSHHAQTSSGKGLPSYFWNRNNVRNILPGLRRKRTGLLLSGPKSSFQIKVNFAFHWKSRSGVWRKSGEAQNPSCLKSSVSSQSQWWFGVPWRRCGGKSRMFKSHASLKSQSKKIKQVKSSQCLTSSKSSQVLLKIKSSRVKSQFYFYLLRVKLFRLITCVNALTLTALIYTYIYIYIYIYIYTHLLSC